MAEFVLTCDDRYCGTCEYWQGPRSVQYYGSRVVFRDIYDSAKCYVPTRGFTWGPNGVNHGPCQDYKKWAAMN